MPGIYRAWDACAAAAGEAVVYRADVPAGAATEGEIPAVLPDWGGSAGDDSSEHGPGEEHRERRGGGCGSDRDGDGFFRAPGPRRCEAGDQFDRGSRVPSEICGIAARGIAEGERQTGAGQPAPDRDESAPRARFKTGQRAGNHRRVAEDCGSPVRELRGAICGSEAATGDAWRRVRGELAAGAGTRLLHADDI